MSDLHSICIGIKTLVMKDALLDELKYLTSEMKFDFMIITGDISDKNKGYTEAKELIYKIIDVINIGIEKVLIVPGNHDINRSIPDERSRLVHECWDIEILDDREKNYIDELVKGQREFLSSYEEILGRTYPINATHFCVDLDENLSIIHLNTAWMCYDSANENGKLHIGLNHVYNCLNDTGLKSKPIKLAIGHHRLNDFNDVVESHMRSIFKSMDIDLYLSGHCHNSAAVYDPAINTEFCSCRQARAEEQNFPAGFIVGNINTDTDQSYFQFYSWDSTLAKWTYDYTVNPSKHGKYYLRGGKFTSVPVNNRNVVIDLKLFGPPLDSTGLMDALDLRNSAIYKTSLRDCRPKSDEEWLSGYKEIRNLYETTIKDSDKIINVFPIAPIPLLVSFGYLLQNDSSNIKIYQYFENDSRWVFDEHDDMLDISSALMRRQSNRLALALSVSAEVKTEDISVVLGDDYDLLSIGIDRPLLSRLNYHSDVQRVKLKIKSELDEIHNSYDEIHLFLAAPAGLCIETGRIIRENMYPPTFVYNYERTSGATSYVRIFDLKQLRSL